MDIIEIEFPNSQNKMDQHEEFFILKGDKDEKIKFHDYQRIYQIPGLYEELFHGKLNCQSPKVIAELLYKNVEQSDTNIQDLKILDFGAGNGMVAEALHEENPDMIVGVDILEEARQAAMRDRSDFYEEYFVEDMAKPQEDIIEELESYQLNTIVSVAALGFDHIPPESFINAFNLINDSGWVAINLRDRFLTNNDESGFKKTLDWLSDEFIDLVDEKTYVHRKSVSGEPINYTGIIGRKINDIN